MQVNKKRVIHNTAYYMLAKYIPIFAAFITLPIYSRYLSPDDYGILAIVGSFTIFIPILFTLYIQSSIPRFYFEYQEIDLIRFLTTVFYFILLLGGSVYFLIFYFHLNILEFVLPNLHSKYYNIFLLSLLSSFIDSLYSIWLSILRVEEKGKKILIFSQIHFLLNLIFTFSFIVIIHYGIFGFVFGTLFSNIIVFLIFSVSYLKYMNPMNIKWAILIKPLKYSTPLIPHEISYKVFKMSDRFILEKYVPYTQIGLYSIGDRISSNALTLMNNFQSAFSPSYINIALVDPDKANKINQNICNKMLVLMSLVIFLMSFFSIDIVQLLLDSRYAEAWIYVAILPLGYVFRLFYIFNTNYIFASKKTYFISTITITSGLINLGINLVLIPKYGIMVALFSTIISLLSLAILSDFFIRKINPEYSVFNKINFGVIAHLLFFSIVAIVVNYKLYSWTFLYWVIKICLLLIFSSIFIKKYKILTIIKELKTAFIK